MSLQWVYHFQALSGKMLMSIVTSKSKVQMGILLEEACKGEKETNFLFMQECILLKFFFSENDHFKILFTFLITKTRTKKRKFLHRFDCYYPP